MNTAAVDVDRVECNVTLREPRDWLLSDANWLGIKAAGHHLAGVFENPQRDRWPSRGTFAQAFL